MPPESSRDTQLPKLQELQAPPLILDNKPSLAIPMPKSLPKGLAKAKITEERWNTEHLPYRIGVDIAAAASAGALVAPVITMIDKYVTVRNRTDDQILS